MTVPKGWIAVTDLAGAAVTVSMQQIVCVRVPVQGEFDDVNGHPPPQPAKSVIELTNGKPLGVTEDPATVVQQIADNS